MAKLSRNQRHKARQKRTLGILKREFRKLYQAHHNATFALLALLQTNNGTVTIHEETLKAVLPKLQTLSWKSERQENGEIVLTLVDTTPEKLLGVSPDEPAMPNVTMRYVDDETAMVSPENGEQLDAEETEPTDGELLTEVLEGDGPHGT